MASNKYQNYKNSEPWKSKEHQTESLTSAIQFEELSRAQQHFWWGCRVLEFVVAHTPTWWWRRCPRVNEVFNNNNINRHQAKEQRAPLNLYVLSIQIIWSCIFNIPGAHPRNCLQFQQTECVCHFFSKPSHSNCVQKFRCALCITIERAPPSSASQQPTMYMCPSSCTRWVPSFTMGTQTSCMQFQCLQFPVPTHTLKT